MQTVQFLFLWLYLTAETEQKGESRLAKATVLACKYARGLGTMRKKPRSWTLGFICVVQAGGSYLGGVGLVGLYLQSFGEVDVG